MGGKVHDPSAARNQRDRTRHLSAVDITLNERVHRREMRVIACSNLDRKLRTRQGGG
jgi:gluconate kinase